MVKNFRINEKVLNTLDPDQWYRGSKSLHERRRFLESFNELKKATKNGEEIAYLSILFLVCNENVETKKIVTALRTKKQINNFAQDIVSKVEIRHKKAESKLSKKQSPQNQRAYDASLIDINETDCLMKQIRRTDYYAKVITSTSVEPIFGPIYNRIAQGMKDKLVNNDDQEEGEDEDEDEIYVGQ